MIAVLLVMTPLAAGSGLTDGACSVWGAPGALGTIEQGALAELSGLASSHAQDALWAVNDSGGGSWVFALAPDGADLGSWAVDGAANTDWEDLAVGPCPSGCACLYVGDVGDQEGAREEIVIWRVPEPDLGGAAERTAAAEALIGRYPDGAHDAETLLVDPLTGELFVIPKAEEAVKVYALPADATPGEPALMEVVGGLDLAELGASDLRVTGGAVSPGGGRVALRTNEEIYVFTAPEGGGVPEALAGEPAVFAAPEGEDGEAVAWARDGAAVLLSGEGLGATVWEIPCLSFEAAAPPEPPALCEEAGKGGCGCATTGAPGLLALALAALGVGLRRRR